MREKIEMPQPAKQIIDTLTGAGYEAYAVGGCVRDSLLGRSPEDWDVTTSAKPEAVKALFRRTVDTGLQHGTVTVMFGKIGYEVTTYRIDGAYEDNRHPKEVVFVTRLVEDLKRRDFTINAMAYNDRTGVVDAFDGLADLANGIIRAVGNPYDRFGEDALRIMRAVRFSAQLGFEIEARTAEAIIAFRENLREVSAERIRVELEKLVCSKFPVKIMDAYRYGITGVILPEFDALPEKDRQEIAARLQRAADQQREAGEVSHRYLCLALLLHPLGDRKARAVLRRLKYDNATIHSVSVLVRDAEEAIELTPKNVRYGIVQTGEDLMPLLFSLKRIIGTQDASYLAAWEAEYRRILVEGDCLYLKDLAVTGADLIALGMVPGKELGETLQKLLAAVLEDPGRNQKEILLADFMQDSV